MPVEIFDVLADGAEHEGVSETIKGDTNREFKSHVLADRY